MESTLAVIFMCLAGAALLLVMVALFRSLSALLSRSPVAIAQHASGAHRDALLGEKRSLLQTLRDLQFERDTGKLSEVDFNNLNDRYRGRARDVLRALDEELSEFRQQASELIAAEIAQHSSAEAGAAATATDAMEAGDVAARDDVDAPRACPQCTTDNDADAVFCKKCGKPLADSEPAS